MTIPVTVLTGFLGAGKTTLLNHALRDPYLVGTFVIVNELGEIPIDHHLVRQASEDVVLLAGGCACCALRGDLVEILESAETSARHSRVFIETSGLVDPTPLLATLLHHPSVSTRYHVDAVLTAVDAEHGSVALAQHPEAQKQAILADDFVITKADRATEAALAVLRGELRRLNPAARTFEASRGALDWRAVLQWSERTVAGRLGKAAGLAAADHGDMRSFCVRTGGALRPHALRALSLWLAMVTQLHGAEVLRIKGLVAIADEPGPTVVQAVQHVLYPLYTLAAWPDADHDTRIVVVSRGLASGVADALRASLEEVLVDPFHPARLTGN